VHLGEGPAAPFKDQPAKTFIVFDARVWTPSIRSLPRTRDDAVVVGGVLAGECATLYVGPDEPVSVEKQTNISEHGSNQAKDVFV
jgi:hypothetical protein